MLLQFRAVSTKLRWVQKSTWSCLINQKIQPIKLQVLYSYYQWLTQSSLRVPNQGENWCDNWLRQTRSSANEIKFWKENLKTVYFLNKLGLR